MVECKNIVRTNIDEYVGEFSTAAPEELANCKEADEEARELGREANRSQNECK